MGFKKIYRKIKETFDKDNPVTVLKELIEGFEDLKINFNSFEGIFDNITKKLKKFAKFMSSLDDILLSTLEDIFSNITTILYFLIKGIAKITGIILNKLKVFDFIRYISMFQIMMFSFSFFSFIYIFVSIFVQSFLNKVLITSGLTLSFSILSYFAFNSFMKNSMTILIKIFKDIDILKILEETLEELDDVLKKLI